MLSDLNDRIDSTFHFVEIGLVFSVPKYKIESNPIGRLKALSVFMASIILSILLAESLSQHGVYLNLR